MKTLNFKCNLLSDVILNQKAATEGPNQTLDFIPGSCFLGIVASKYDSFGNEKALEIFHSGKVRFGDAHPSKDDVRGLKIPASMFYPKLKQEGFKYYIHHAIPDDKLESDEFKKMQLKQCRNGFYTFAGNEAKQVKTETNFAIKSAYDRDKRRSKDEQMYGYESLQEGLELYFEVQVDNEDLADEIKNALTKGGSKRVGRSRTAQYGLVKIEFLGENEIELSTNETTLINGKKCVTVYADGRLIFLDEYGLPTYRPTAAQLGLPENAEILWEKSQIRTFQYAPWNYKRQCFDTDRCGIEKGSVFVVDVSRYENLDLQSTYIGSYNNEGFGKVIYNPDFLKANLEDGIAQFQINENKDGKKPDVDIKSQTKQEIDNLNSFKSNLSIYLAAQKHQEYLENDVFSMVNDWVEKNWDSFKGESFASQWGAIRSIAMKNRTKQSLSYELFDKKSKKNGKEIPDAYLTHGVAADKWNERGRKKTFKEFFDKLNDENAQMAIINLAAEMAKKCRKENK